MERIFETPSTLNNLLDILAGYVVQSDVRSLVKSKVPGLFPGQAI